MSSPTPRSARWLPLVGGLAAATLFVAFLIGLVGAARPLLPASDNWLIVLFNLNFRPESTDASALAVGSAMDIVIMVLFGVVMAAMYPALSPTSRLWAAISAALPFLGIPIFLATGTAGRSAVLLAAFISSILALRTPSNPSRAAYSGLIASSLLLFVGDFGTAAFPSSTLLAVLIGVGYVLWTIWLLLISLQLLRGGQHAAA
jgi:hypothetical protein